MLLCGLDMDGRRRKGGGTYWWIGRWLSDRARLHRHLVHATAASVGGISSTKTTPYNRVTRHRLMVIEALKIAQLTGAGGVGHGAAGWRRLDWRKHIIVFGLLGYPNPAALE